METVGLERLLGFKTFLLFSMITFHDLCSFIRIFDVRDWFEVVAQNLFLGVGIEISRLCLDSTIFSSVSFGVKLSPLFLFILVSRSYNILVNSS